MKFTETYKAARNVVESQSFADGEWKTFLEVECGIKRIFSAEGFDTASADHLDKIRKKIIAKARHTNSLAIALFGGGPGQVIFEAAQNKSSGGTWQQRAAVLEFIRCLYRDTDTGGAGVWIYSPAKDHTKPIFDELNVPDRLAKSKLGLKNEIFTSEDRRLMGDALAVSRKVVGDTIFKLSGANADTKAVVRRWITGEGSSDTEVDKAIAILLAGFKKIAVSCSASTLVFTDYIDWRKKRDDYYGAAFRGGEGGGFPVIYLEGAFVRLQGPTGKMWLASETIIHELSHHDVSTQDHRYDSSGLKPGSNVFPASKAIENADSWGYFAIDLAGYLSQTDRDKVCK